MLRLTSFTSKEGIGQEYQLCDINWIKGDIGQEYYLCDINWIKGGIGQVCQGRITNMTMVILN